MDKQTIIFFCETILSHENRAQFNRTRFLCQNFSTHIIGMGPVSSKASHGATSVTLFPFQGKIFRCLYPFWILWLILRIRMRYDVEFLYSTFEPLNIIVSYLAKVISGIKWVEDLWDDPEKSVLLRRSLPGFGSALILYIKYFEFLIAKNLLKNADKFIIGVIPKGMYEKTD